MSRRPKLSLGPDNHVEKKQAPLFGTGEAPETPGPIRGTAAPTRQDSGRHGKGKTEGLAVVDETLYSGTRSTGGRLIKVALVVVAAALSLYLLKRRLM